MDYLEIKECSRLQSSDSVQPKGLYTKKAFKKNQTVFELQGDIEKQQSKYSIHIGKNQHVIDEYGTFMNHSFDPTTRIEGRSVIANKDLVPGDELSFDYNSSEINMSCPFESAEGIMVTGVRQQV